MLGDPAQVQRMQDITGDPARIGAYAEFLKREEEDPIARGETPYERALREKREWAEQDALSARIKEKVRDIPSIRSIRGACRCADGQDSLQGNAALKAGDLRQAYLCYTACVPESAHEPLYWLNRAQACLLMHA
jgi:hypothetical protein